MSIYQKVHTFNVSLRAEENFWGRSCGLTLHFYGSSANSICVSFLTQCVPLPTIRNHPERLSRAFSVTSVLAACLPFYAANKG